MTKRAKRAKTYMIICPDCKKSLIIPKEQIISVRSM